MIKDFEARRRSPHEAAIYLDYSATTPVDPRVAEKMILTEFFGNAASRSHAFGWKAEEAVEEARARRRADQCRPEGDRVDLGRDRGQQPALKGAANFYKTKGKHIITQKTEHKAVLDTCRELERQGFEVTYLEVHRQLVDLKKFEAAIRPDTILASIMMVNNEIGVIAGVGDRRDLQEEGRGLPLRRGAGRRAHRDRHAEVQGRSAHHHRAQDVRPERHRRALRAAQSRVRIEAQIHGGGHERLPLGCLPRTRSSASARRRASRSSRWRPRTSASARCATGC